MRCMRRKSPACRHPARSRPRNYGGRGRKAPSGAFFFACVLTWSFFDLLYAGRANSGACQVIHRLFQGLPSPTVGKRDAAGACRSSFGACALAGRRLAGPGVRIEPRDFIRTWGAVAWQNAGPVDLRGFWRFERCWAGRFRHLGTASAIAPPGTISGGLGTGRLGKPLFYIRECVALRSDRRQRFGGPGTGRPGKPPFYASRRATAPCAPVRGPGTGRPGKPLFYTGGHRREVSPLHAYSGWTRMFSRQRPSTSALSQSPCNGRVDTRVRNSPFP